MYRAADNFFQRKLQQDRLSVRSAILIIGVVSLALWYAIATLALHFI